MAAVAEQAQLLENPSGTTTDPEPTSIDQLTEQYKAAVRRQQQSLDDQRVELIETNSTGNGKRSASITRKTVRNMSGRNNRRSR